MIRFTAILVLLIILFESSGKLMVFACYQLNKEYISNNLCENRSKPTMHCNGKCHLTKQLNKEEKQEQAPENMWKEKFEVLLFSESTTSSFNQVNLSNTHYFSKYLITPYTSLLASVDRPPQA